MQKRIKLQLMSALALFLSLLISPNGLSNTVMAEGELNLQSVTLYESGIYQTTSPRNLADGELIPRNSNVLKLRFNLPVTSDTAQDAISVRDSSGDGAPLANPSYQTVYSSSEYYLFFTSLLKPNELYTITIKGGQSGIKTEYGNTLPDDVSFTFRTGGTPVLDTRQVETFFDSWAQPHVNILNFTAEQGPLKLQSFIERYKLAVSVQDAVTQKVLFTDILTGSRDPLQPEGPATFPIKEYQLPRTGEYNLIVAPMFEGFEMGGDPDTAVNINISANELQIPGKRMGHISTPDWKPYQILNEPFSINIMSIDVPTTSLEVQVDNKLVRNNEPFSIGTKSIPIDTANLADGMHKVTIIVDHEGSKNRSILERYFIVNRNNSYNDVPSGFWAHEVIETMSNLGHLKGFGDGSFGPNQPVTREQFATMFARTLHLSSTSGLQRRFEDTPSEWANESVTVMSEKGIIQGESYDGKWYFYPKRSITRAEVAAILSRFLGNQQKHVFDSWAPREIKDFWQTPYWAQRYVADVYEKGYMQGLPDGNFYANQQITRAEAAKILSKFVGR